MTKPIVSGRLVPGDIVDIGLTAEGRMRIDLGERFHMTLHPNDARKSAEAILQFADKIQAERN